MGYEDALEAAGAEVIDFEQFGDYQGTWIAFVRYEGQLGFITESYGSCSGCDDWEAFDYGTLTDIENPEESRIKLAEFGKPYLDSMYTFEEMMENCGESTSWDQEALTMRAWLEGKKKHFSDIEFNKKVDKLLNE